MNDQPKIPSLDDSRAAIDRIDRELVRLFCERMGVSADVAAYKCAVGKPVTDAARERALLCKISELAGPEMEAHARTLYATILSISRAYQHERLNTASTLADKIEAAKQQTAPLFPARAKVACQGVEGAYSLKAAEKLFSCPEVSFYKTFDDVFAAIDSGECRYGVLPIENSTAGSVTQIYDLMSCHRFYIVRALRLKVDHCLLVKPGTKQAQIKEVVSHQQALSQCAGYIAGMGDVRVTPFPNTAKAAAFVKNADSNAVAAIASKECAAIYGLEVLCEDIQDNGNNYTRFICISKTPEIYPGADKTSIILTVPHKPGSLSRLLAQIDAMQINLTKLESRPIPGHDFEFLFYFDLESPIESPALLRLLGELESSSEKFRYLGTYREML
ncbi:MAG: bifunctional chorismate mutase/prephenate dehydratase [Ruminococcaceae bacterium]|nr:bifunctional chorismate mutase/prephenate dehydratase [Oscillospiraceae bacterium]